MYNFPHFSLKLGIVHIVLQRPIIRFDRNIYRIYVPIICLINLYSFNRKNMIISLIWMDLRSVVLGYCSVVWPVMDCAQPHTIANSQTKYTCNGLKYCNKFIMVNGTIQILSILKNTDMYLFCLYNAPDNEFCTFKTILLYYYLSAWMTITRGDVWIIVLNQLINVTIVSNYLVYASENYRPFFGVFILHLSYN